MPQDPLLKKLPLLDAWLADKAWQPFAFQLEAWRAYLEGKSGLIHAPTGFGKTLAAWLGPVLEAASTKQDKQSSGLKVLWITPLRALAADTVRALREPLEGLGLPWRVESRTGDTSASQKARQKAALPQALVTTPESLSLLLAQKEPQALFRDLQAVIVDEWHELLSSKRGVQTELCLARLRQWRPSLRIWGVSATIGNLPQAAAVLLGNKAEQACVVHCQEKKRIEITALLPEDMSHFPWSGHLGREMAAQVIQKVLSAKTTLLFTNTRSQTEIWFQALSELRPDLVPHMAMHHGSLDRAEREGVEQRLRDGLVRCVVCTSSLDLGVDFSPVEQVIQLGSPKGIARILQRAGRSGHQPGATSHILGVPTNAFELVEFAAARDAVQARAVESRVPVRLAVDVLVQHLITVSIGSGFRPCEMLAEVRSTHAYAELTDAMWQWVLAFISQGGKVLQAYPDYHKVLPGEDGVWRIASDRLARLHKLGIGTISSDPSISVRHASGRRLGTVEEWFISKIKPGGQFIFGGRRWELIRTKDMVAHVKDATKSKKTGQIPSWQGGKSPLSTELAKAVARKLREPDGGPEMAAVAPILAIQRAWSCIPGENELLVEQTRTKEGTHVYFYPFAGRVIHEGIATLLAHRFSRTQPASIRFSFNDYGFELASNQDLFREGAFWQELLTPDQLKEDMAECLNTHELARRQFREISRVAGLVLTGFPGGEKPLRALQASSGLLYDTLARYDEENLLLQQARWEILERQFDFTRLHETLSELSQRKIVLVNTQYLTPMAFPLWADSLGASLTSETFSSRLAQMLEELELAAVRAEKPENRPERE